jgi:sugar phosphate isomerase/epimerase
VKVGLYSITYLGIWYDGPALSLPEVVDRAVAHGYDGIEIDGKRPHGNPMDWDDRRRRELRELCGAKGLAIVGVASNNDFSSPVPEHRECQLLMVREQIRLCRDLDGRYVRVFFAWPGVTLGANGLATYEVARGQWAENARYSTFLDKWEAIRATLREAARIAENEGVALALQNHTPVLRTYRDMLAMVREVDSPALRACLDVPILERQDDDYVARAVRETGDLQVLSHFGGEFERGADGHVVQKVLEPKDPHGPAVNYPTFIRALKTAGYDGYLNFEFCHQALTERHDVAGLDYVDEQANLAAEYLRNLLIAEGAYTTT